MNDSNEWKVMIQEDIPSGRFNFYIKSMGNGNLKHFVSDAKNGDISLMQEGDTITPAFTLTNGMMEALFLTLQQRGMKPVEQSFNEGKLEAIQQHLSDMRTLVFNK